MNAHSFGASHQCVDQATVFDHMGEGLTRVDFATECQKGRADSVAEFRVGDDHLEDRLGIRRNSIPYAERFKQSAAGRNDCRCTRVATWAIHKRWIGNHNRDISTKTLAQGKRQSHSRKCSTADDNAALLWHVIPRCFR